MLVPKRNRVIIYNYLFTEGCIVILDDPTINRTFKVDEQSEEVSVPNIEVIKVLQSLWSSGYVKKTYSWRHFYYFLTDSGIEYIRNYLHIPSSVAPKTLVAKAPTRPEPEERPRINRGNGQRRVFRGDRRPLPQTQESVSA